MERLSLYMALKSERTYIQDVGFGGIHGVGLMAWIRGIWRVVYGLRVRVWVCASSKGLSASVLNQRLSGLFRFSCVYNCTCV